MFFLSFTWGNSMNEKTPKKTMRKNYLFLWITCPTKKTDWIINLVLTWVLRDARNKTCCQESSIMEWKGLKRFCCHWIIVKFRFACVVTYVHVFACVKLHNPFFIRLTFAATIVMLFYDSSADFRYKFTCT